MRKSIKGSNLQTCLKTIYKLRNFCYILPICTEASHRRICTKFGTGVGVAAIMTSDKYFGKGLRSVVFVGGQISPLAIEKPSHHLQGMALPGS